MNDKKVCFIICTNHDFFLDECLFYLEHLKIPEGFEREVLTVHDAKSMTSGYNEAMRSSDAKYKVYMHQDVFILNKNFIDDIVSIFQIQPLIGMIGMIGPIVMPDNGIMWNNRSLYGNIYARDMEEADYSRYNYDVEEHGIIEVEAVDGLLIATQYDIPWREDIFDGWDLYDASQSAEFRRAGYSIVVPVQQEAWCIHDDGKTLSMWNYNKYRERYLKEYRGIKIKKTNKIAFIIAVNDEQIYEECILYLEQLYVPDGYEIEVIKVTDAKSMTAAYNEGMESSDAEYKIYLHQDVFIINRNFIHDVLRIFNTDVEIGMIGVIGGINLPDSAIMWNSWNCGKTCACNIKSAMLVKMNQNAYGEAKVVEALDGMLMITQYDIPWREDLFTGWDFYDVSQSYEFRRRGYKLVVPYQEKAWCLHDCGHSNLESYDNSRRVFINEYKDFQVWIQEYAAISDEEKLKNTHFIKDKLIIVMNEILSGNFNNMKELDRIIGEVYPQLYEINELSLMSNITEIFRCEQYMDERVFFEGVCNWTDLCKKYNHVKFVLRRIEYGIPDADKVLLELIQEGQVSCVSIVVIGNHSLQDCNYVKVILKWCYKQLKQESVVEWIDKIWEI